MFKCRGWIVDLFKIGSEIFIKGLLDRIDFIICYMKEIMFENGMIVMCNSEFDDDGYISIIFDM